MQFNASIRAKPYLHQNRKLNFGARTIEVSIRQRVYLCTLRFQYNKIVQYAFYRSCMADVSSSFEMFSLFCFIERNLLNLYSVSLTSEVKSVPNLLAKICRKFYRYLFNEVHFNSFAKFIKKVGQVKFHGLDVQGYMCITMVLTTGS